MQSAGWWESTANPSAVTSIYSEVPQLSGVRVMSIHLDDDGPTVLVRCSLPTFPDKPPLRWKQHAYDAVLIELRLFGASDVRLEAWSNESTGTVALTRDGSAIHALIAGEGIRFAADALSVEITHVEGYHRSR